MYNFCSNRNQSLARRRKTLSFSLNPDVLPLTQGHAVDLHSVCGGLLDTNKGRSASPSANHCQGQMQNRQSVTLRKCPFSNAQPIGPKNTLWCSTVSLETDRNCSLNQSTTTSFRRIHNSAHTIMQYTGATCLVSLTGSVNKLQDGDNFEDFKNNGLFKQWYYYEPSVMYLVYFNLF